MWAKRISWYQQPLGSINKIKVIKALKIHYFINYYPTGLTPLFLNLKYTRTVSQKYQNFINLETVILWQLKFQVTPGNWALVKASDISLPVLYNYWAIENTWMHGDINMHIMFTWSDIQIKDRSNPFSKILLFDIWIWKQFHSKLRLTETYMFLSAVFPHGLRPFWVQTVYTIYL